MSKQKLFVISAAAAGIIALFLPVVKIMDVSANAMKTGSLGYILLVMFGVSLLLCLTGKPTAALKKGSIIGIVVCAVIALLFLLLNIANLPSGMGLGVLGAGFWLALLASVALPVFAFVLKNK